MLAGIVRVLRRRASWRALPKESGEWETANKRYRQWRAEGRRERIADVIGITDAEVAL